MKIFLTLLLVCALLVAGCVTGTVKQTEPKNSKANNSEKAVSEWCKVGENLEFKGKQVDVIGVVDAFGGKACHVAATEGDATADFYLDKTALNKFLDDSQEDAGTGCVVLGAGESKTTMCFGDVDEEEFAKSLE